MTENTVPTTPTNSDKDTVTHTIWYSTPDEPHAVLKTEVQGTQRGIGVSANALWDRLFFAGFEMKSTRFDSSRGDNSDDDD